MWVSKGKRIGNRLGISGNVTIKLVSSTCAVGECYDAPLMLQRYEQVSAPEGIQVQEGQRGGKSIQICLCEYVCALDIAWCVLLLCYWHFRWWFQWAYSIRITEGFHLSPHAKEVSLEPLFTNQVGFAALIHSRAQAQQPGIHPPPSSLPISPVPLPLPSAPPTPTSAYSIPTLTRRSLRLSFCRSSPVFFLFYFLPESLQNFPDCRVFM